MARDRMPEGFVLVDPKRSIDAPRLSLSTSEDGTHVELAADDLGRISQSKMVATFQRAALDLESFLVVRDTRVVSAEVTRIA
jgi:hypothetical protein